MIPRRRIPFWSLLTGLVAAGGITYFAALYLLGFRVRDFARQVPR